MKKVIVVEDEAAIREVIALNLRMAGYDVTEAANAEQACSVFDETYDIAILDIMLPKMNGFSLCENMRGQSAGIGIIMLSAKALEEDKIKGLSIGADDYMTKPFSISELLARVDALWRRVKNIHAVKQNQPVQDDENINSGIFNLNKRSRILYKNNDPIDLTQVEFQIMELFLTNPGVALVREKILEGVWGEHYFGDVKIVDVNIRRLRMKIEEEPSSPKYILTVWGYGYRWNTQ